MKYYLKWKRNLHILKAYAEEATMLEVYAPVPMATYLDPYH